MTQANKPGKPTIWIEQLVVHDGYIDATVFVSPDSLLVPDAVARKLLGLFPHLGEQVCVSGRHRIFADEIYGTEAPHLLEHLAIELLVLEARQSGSAKGFIFTGRTTMKKEATTPHARDCLAVEEQASNEQTEMLVSLRFEHDLIALRALKEAASLINWAYLKAADETDLPEESYAQAAADETDLPEELYAQPRLSDILDALSALRST